MGQSADAAATAAQTPDSNKGNNGHVKPLETLIIGSGPAGYTAAIYAARAGLKPVMYTGQEPGGQLMITTDVENYPGYPDGIMGPAMMEQFQKQAERFGTDVRYDMVEKVDFSGPVHKVWTSGGDEVHAHTVIVSTGASAKWLGLESEKRLANVGVSACAVCDGFFFKGQNVAVVGAGDTAAEEASYLAKLCPEVHMIVRRDEMRASKIMQKRVMNTPNITIHWNTETDEVLGEKEVTGVRVKNNKTGEKTEIAISGFFVAIGHKPNTDIFKGSLDMHENGYLKVVPGTSNTNIEGVFVSGDAADQVYRQAVTAAGTGCMAALDAERYLAAKELV
ncbi:MAG: thioredoxin-disulfide reductase [Saprospiraceae bacterium]